MENLPYCPNKRNKIKIKSYFNLGILLASQIEILEDLLRSCFFSPITDIELNEGVLTSISIHKT